MTQTVDIYIAGVKVMTAVATADSASLGTVADVTPATGNFGGIYYKGGTNTLDADRGFLDWPEIAGNGTRSKPPHAPSLHGRCIIQATSGNNIGKSICTKIITDAGSTSLVIQDKWPFAD